MSMYWIIFIGFALLSWLVSSRLQNKFEKYSKIPMPNGMTGKDVAEKMLHDNGIYDGLCASSDAFGFGSGRQLCFQHYDMGAVGWYAVD